MLACITRRSKSQGVSLPPNSKQAIPFQSKNPRHMKRLYLPQAAYNSSFLQNLCYSPYPPIPQLPVCKLCSDTAQLCNREEGPVRTAGRSLHPHTSHPLAPEPHLSPGLCLSPQMASALGPDLAKVRAWLDSDPPGNMGYHHSKSSKEKVMVSSLKYISQSQYMDLPSF